MLPRGSTDIASVGRSKDHLEGAAREALSKRHYAQVVMPVRRNHIGVSAFEPSACPSASCFSFGKRELRIGSMKKPAILLALVLLGTHPTEIAASSPIGKVRVPKLPAQQQIHNLSELKEKYGPVETAEAENGRIKSLIVDFIPLGNWKRESAIEAIAQFIGEIAPVLGIPDPENYLFVDVQILPDGGREQCSSRLIEAWMSGRARFRYIQLNVAN